MTRDEAEDIWMANQAGVFHGPKSELAIATLVLSQPDRTLDAISEMVGNYWLCASCDEWKHGMPAGHNFSGPVCDTCEAKV